MNWPITVLEQRRILFIDNNHNGTLIDAVVIQNNKRDIIAPTKTSSADEQRRGRDSVPLITIIPSEPKLVVKQIDDYDGPNR